MASVTIPAAKTIRVSNPASGELLAELACASRGDVQSAIDRARAAQPAWEAVSVAQRARIVRRFTEVLIDRKRELAELISRESGKPLAEAMISEIVVTLDAARFCAGAAQSLFHPEPVPHSNPLTMAKRGVLTRAPYGVIGIIAPWNYPVSIPATEVLAALATGNCVVLKPSEFTPLCALKLVEILREAGVPNDAVQVVVGDGSTGAALLDCQRPVDKLIFTGSVATGKKVAALAAPRLIPVVLELGGKDPMIVLADADLEAATSAAVWGAFLNAGQTCLSVERCYVHRSIFDHFAALCTEKTMKLKVGPGSAPDTDVGPMIHSRQLDVVSAQVNEAVQAGARLLCGGCSLPALGPNFYAPTILIEINHSMRLLREETFGPVLPIMPFASDDESIALANDSEFGLAASIWTRDERRGEALARRLNAGTVLINDVVSGFAISEAPHGGIKSSGIGRTHGRAGLEEMVWTRYVDIDQLPAMKKIWWYPYGARFAQQLEGFAEMLFARDWGTRIRGAIASRSTLFRKRL